MKLFEIASTFDAVKKLNAEFKSLAAELNLSLIAGIGWPNLTKDGAWYGGGIANKGGTRSKRDDIMDEETRVEVFIHALTKKLEEFLEEGRVVRVGKGAARSAGITDVTPGQALEALRSNLIVQRPPGNTTRKANMPCVVWYVSNPVEMAGKTTITLYGSIFYKDNEAKRLGFSTTSNLPHADVSKIKKWVEANHKPGKQSSKEIVALCADLARASPEEALRSYGGAQLSDVSSMDNVLLYAQTGAHSHSTAMIEPAEFLAAVKPHIPL